MPTFVTGFLGISSLLAVLLFFLASSDIAENLSPQGCRMSWMSPSYVLQPDLDTNWSPLARRYSLWLYREVGWDSVQESGRRRGSLPVLFIPGNAGSSHQVRSIASSASRQYYSSPYSISPEFESRSLKPLDFFAVEFNEDLSAFHGSTIESQISYTTSAISYILSLYPTSTKVIVMGHSMGGIVATSLLPSNNISAIITMSTPHTLPPARFDSRIDTIYDRLQLTLDREPTPIVSICGGATDMMIASESCVLPKPSNDVFRRTVFTSALEGAWTGVGHREMVWCHQVRWRVARSALELGAADTPAGRALVLDKWLRDGHSLPPQISEAGPDKTMEVTDMTTVEVLPAWKKLTIQNPKTSKTYLLPVQRTSESQKVTVLVSQGSIPPVAPQNPLPFRISIYSCTSVQSGAKCIDLKPETLKLIPNPIAGMTFPVPSEGSDESEGIVLFEAHIPKVELQPNDKHWIAVKVDGADGRGWFAASLGDSTPVRTNMSTFSLLMGGRLVVDVPLNENDGALSTSFTFPNLISSALVIYRVTFMRHSMPQCSEALMAPLIMHTSQPAETHYYPVTMFAGRRILLHTHRAAPFVYEAPGYPTSLDFTIYSTIEGDCRDEFKEFEIAIDLSATLGRWSSRYLHTLISWAAGVAVISVFLAWSQEDHGGSVPSVPQSLDLYGRGLFRYLILASLLMSVIPLPESIYLGNKSSLLFAPIAPLILLIASGLVCVSWYMLVLLLTVIGKASSFLVGSRGEKASIHRGTILSLSIVCIIIFVFVPWQVAYLGCWLLHLYTCASSRQELGSFASRNKTIAVPLIQSSRRRGSIQSTEMRVPLERRPSGLRDRDVKQDNLNHNMHLLLLMTWLLPLTAPVLAVWVRTLLTAGYTTPFDGDHNFLAVLPFLVLVDFVSWTPGQLYHRPRFEQKVSLRWPLALIAVVAFLFGSRRPYLVLDAARIVVWIIVVCRIGPRYWGGSSWSAGQIAGGS
ncbi:GPI-inositol-deacylase [Crassisporium funariophilum]|nr:GPI-inositol-deacylase [Crassisporium funariophilum]